MTTRVLVQTTGDESGCVHAGTDTSACRYHGGLTREQCHWFDELGGN